MALSLADIKRNTIGPPRVLIYGDPGIGKSESAACSRNPIFMPLEDGMGTINAMALPQARDYAQVVEGIELLIHEPHDYQTLVVDTLDKLEPIIWTKTCASTKTDKGATAVNIHSYGFHKGFDHALPFWREILDGFDALRAARGMAIVLVSHASIVHLDPPDVDPYDRYQPSIEKKAEAVVRDWCDAVLFMKTKVTAVESEGRRDDRKRGAGSGQRVLLTTERPAWRAKNRYGMDSEIQIPEGQPEAVWNSLEAAIAKRAGRFTEAPQVAAATT